MRHVTRRCACFLAAAAEVELVRSHRTMSRLDRHAAVMRARRILEGGSGHPLPRSLESKIRAYQATTSTGESVIA